MDIWKIIFIGIFILCFFPEARTCRACSMPQKNILVRLEIIHQHQPGDPSIYKPTNNHFNNPFNTAWEDDFFFIPRVFVVMTFCSFFSWNRNCTCKKIGKSQPSFASSEEEIDFFGTSCRFLVVISSIIFPFFHQYFVAVSLKKPFFELMVSYFFRRKSNE